MILFLAWVKASPGFADPPKGGGGAALILAAHTSNETKQHAALTGASSTKASGQLWKILQLEGKSSVQENGLIFGLGVVCCSPE